MQFKATIDIWALSDSERAAIQPGQWVKAGDNGSRGQYMGMKPGGSDVVAWRNGRKNYANKRRMLRQYALAK